MKPPKVFDHCGSDRHIAAYFWASTDKVETAFTCPESDIRRVIRFGMKAKPVPHGTPFGHSVVTFWLEDVPSFVVAQWERHRAQNYSEESFRYVVSDGDFWVPEPMEVRTQIGRPGHYTYQQLDRESAEEGIAIVKMCGKRDVASYQRLLDLGWCPEQARTVLPQGIHKKLFATASLRNWLNFCVQRNDIHAQAEIRMLAAVVEARLADLYPITVSLWAEEGRRII